MIYSNNNDNYILPLKINYRTHEKLLTSIGVVPSVHNQEDYYNHTPQLDVPENAHELFMNVLSFMGQCSVFKSMQKEHMSDDATSSVEEGSTMSSSTPSTDVVVDDSIIVKNIEQEQKVNELTQLLQKAKLDLEQANLLKDGVIKTLHNDQVAALRLEIDVMNRRLKDMESEKQDIRVAYENLQTKFQTSNAMQGAESELATFNLLANKTTYRIEKSNTRFAEGDMHIHLKDSLDPGLSSFVSLENKKQKYNRSEHCDSSLEVVKNLYNKYPDRYLGHIFLSTTARNVNSKGNFLIEVCSEISDPTRVPPPIMWIGFDNLHKTPHDQEVFKYAVDMFMTYCMTIRSINANRSSQDNKILELHNIVNSHTRAIAKSIIIFNNTQALLSQTQASLTEGRAAIHEQFQSLCDIILTQAGTGASFNGSQKKKLFSDLEMNKAYDISNQLTPSSAVTSTPKSRRVKKTTPL